jgi:hypothetical protein
MTYAYVHSRIHNKVKIGLYLILDALHKIIYDNSNNECTASQCLSAIKDAAFEMFPENRLFKEADFSTFYTDLRNCFAKGD